MDKHSSRTHAEPNPDNRMSFCLIRFYMLVLILFISFEHFTVQVIISPISFTAFVLRSIHHFNMQSNINIASRKQKHAENSENIFLIFFMRYSVKQLIRFQWNSFVTKIDTPI